MTGAAFPFVFNSNLFVPKYYLPFLVPFLLFLLKYLGLWQRKARPPPKTSAPQPNAHIDKSARPPRPETGTGSGGATRLPIISLDYVLF